MRSLEDTVGGYEPIVREKAARQGVEVDDLERDAVVAADIVQLENFREKYDLDGYEERQ